MPPEKPKQPTAIARLAAFAYGKYAPALHKYVMRRLRRSEETADLTQTIFERFLQVEDVELIRNPQAYLYGIASHVVSEFRMRETHNVVTFDSEIADHLSDGVTHATPDDAAESMALRREIDEALAQLPDTHRAVLLMVKRDGLSYEETARALQLTVNTVGTYVMEARTKIKSLLESRDGR